MIRVHAVRRPASRKLPVTLLALLLASPALLRSQITARQGGTSPTTPAGNFSSPMVLEFPATDLLGASRGYPWPISGIQGYNCERARFSMLNLTLKGKAKSGFTLAVDGALDVSSSHDRQARVIVDLLVDGKVVGSASRDRIEAEEREVTPFRFSKKISKQASQALESSPAASVRVTLFVWNH